MQVMECDCGHKNPYGTLLCQACGKPLQSQADGNQVVASMRYEGSAIRSKTYNKTAVDKIWNFFSSVKVGITIIVILLIAAAIGTIFPQAVYIPPTADPTDYYAQQYGTLGEIYYLLGFDNLYGSWWFISLLGMLGLSIVVASIDRGAPLYKSLKNQRVTRHDNFLKNQKFFVQAGKTDYNQVESILKSLHYRVRRENGSLLAEKGRFSRWGPYVNHTGLIIFLIGAMLRFFPGMYVDETVWIREGETAALPGTKTDQGQYYLKNNQFTLQFYDKNDKVYGKALSSVDNPVPKNYQTNVTLYHSGPDAPIGGLPNLTKVKDGKIKVNGPLNFDAFSVYQVDFKLNELHEMMFNLVEKSTGKSMGSLSINLINPKKEYKLPNGSRVVLEQYFPNFYLNDQNEPDTKNDIPDNPAFVFYMYTPNTPKGEKAFVGIMKNVEGGNNRYKMSFAGIQTKNLTALEVKKDRTIGMIAVGGLIFMIGVVQGLYWNHRRIWLKEKEGGVWLAAHTNKNWFSLKKDLKILSSRTGIQMPEEKPDEQENSSGGNYGTA